MGCVVTDCFPGSTPQPSSLPAAFPAANPLATPSGNAPVSTAQHTTGTNTVESISPGHPSCLIFKQRGLTDHYRRLSRRQGLFKHILPLPFCCLPALCCSGEPCPAPAGAGREQCSRMRETAREGWAGWKALGKVTGQLVFTCSHPWWEFLNLVKCLHNFGGGLYFPSCHQILLTTPENKFNHLSLEMKMENVALLL